MPTERECPENEKNKCEYETPGAPLSISLPLNLWLKPPQQQGMSFTLQLNLRNVLNFERLDFGKQSVPTLSWLLFLNSDICQGPRRDHDESLSKFYG